MDYTGAILHALEFCQREGITDPQEIAAIINASIQDATAEVYPQAW